MNVKFNLEKKQENAPSNKMLMKEDLNSLKNILNKKSFIFGKRIDSRRTQKEYMF